MQDSATDSVIHRFVRELDALQRTQNGRVTLEEIVQAMAARCSAGEITPAGVAEVLRSVYYDGIAHTATSPNPADYNRPLILLWLNREHPVVRAALAGEPIPRKERRTQRTDFKFPLGAVTGEPLSEQIIRDRR